MRAPGTCGALRRGARSWAAEPRSRSMGCVLVALTPGQQIGADIANAVDAGRPNRLGLPMQNHETCAAKLAFAAEFTLVSSGRAVDRVLGGSGAGPPLHEAAQRHRYRGGSCYTCGKQ